MTPCDAAASAFYRDALERLSQSGIPFLVGGAFALGHYTSIERHTKDLDLFLREADVGRALDLFRAAGYSADLPFPHWLGKVCCGSQYVDLIFQFRQWRRDRRRRVVRSRRQRRGSRAAGAPVPAGGDDLVQGLRPGAERSDGADVLHLLRVRGRSLDWDRLMARFGPHWRVLFAHLVMFGFVYPGRQHHIPRWVTDTLLARFAADRDNDEVPDTVCNGTLLSREQYVFDVNDLAYDDARVEPRGRLTPREVSIWTAAIDDEK